MMRIIYDEWLINHTVKGKQRKAEEILQSDVRSILEKMNMNKATGPGGIIRETLSALGPFGKF